MAEQKQGWIQPSISWGNLIVLASIGVSLAVGWTRLETGLENHDHRIEELEDGAKAMVAERMKQNGDMADLKADMRWIRVTLERLERDLKGR